MRAAITNVQVGDDIGLAHSTVSRIRSGDRLPSVDIMVEIERVYQWKVNWQIRARMNGNYAEKFEELLMNRFGVEDDARHTA